MTRQALCDCGTQQASAHSLAGLDPVAEAFSGEIRSHFGENILSGSFGDRIDPTTGEAAFYVAARDWVVSKPQPEPKYYYEEHFHLHFWPGFSDDRPLLVLYGKEGSGKSTLLRFYYDCYLPNYPAFPSGQKREVAHGPWAAETDRHVILYAHLRRACSPLSPESDMFRQFRAQLSRRFPGLLSESNYAMWDRLANWSAKHHADAEEDHATQSAYRSYYIEDFKKSDQSVVEEALWYLSNLTDTTGGRKCYVSLVCDNVDQRDFRAQTTVLETLVGILGDRASGCPHQTSEWIPGDRTQLWRVVVALRPETLSRLAFKLQPMNSKHEISLGRLDFNSMLRVRGEATSKAIRGTNRMADTDVAVDADSACAYIPISSSVAAAGIQRTLSVTIDPGAPGFTAATRALVDNFCNASNRRCLRLHRRMLENATVADFVRHCRPGVAGSEHLSHYTVVDALLRGGYEHFNYDEMDNDFVNLYRTTTLTPDAYTTLLGSHVLYLIKRGCKSTEELCQLLNRIGYTSQEILECLACFTAKALIVAGPADDTGHYSFESERPILDAYTALLRHAAYTDNMAVVTPVEDDKRAKMSLTLPYGEQEFKTRVSTAIAFLGQLKADERTLMHWNPSLYRHQMAGAQQLEFNKALNALALPSVYRKAAAGYFERLRKLRNLDRLPGIADTEWADFLDNPTLRVTESDANRPLRV